jgi:hypothetical protein
LAHFAAMNRLQGIRAAGYPTKPAVPSAASRLLSQTIERALENLLSGALCDD